MKNLNSVELLEINGGHDGVGYKAGKFVGDVIEVYVTIFGIGKIAKWLKNL